MRQKKNSLLVNFLYSGHSFGEDEILLKFQYRVLNSVLVVIGLFSFIFSFLSSLGLNPLGIVQTIANYILAVITIFIIVRLRGPKKRFKQCAYVMYGFSFLSFVSAFIFVPDDEFRMIWFYLLAFAAYITGGIRAGNIIIVLSIGIIFFSNIFLELYLTQKAVISSILGLVITMLFFRSYTKKIIDFDKEIIQQDNFIINQLKNKVDEEVKKRRDQENMIVSRSRQAQMGEMISMIAHQWRQPLGAISSNSIDLQMKLSLEAFDLQTKEGVEEAKEYFLNSLASIDSLVQNLTVTIDDFRNFFKQNKQSTNIKLHNVVVKSLNIIKSSLIHDNIDLVEEYNSKKDIKLYENELIQVILNILKNAQDNFKDKNIKNPKITITTDDDTISICDNGGGIPDDIMKKIFDPYFSTKDDKNGTGLGLYMSKTIVEDHHNGKLIVENKDVGACFKIKLGTIIE